MEFVPSLGYTTLGHSWSDADSQGEEHYAFNAEIRLPRARHHGCWNCEKSPQLRTLCHRMEPNTRKGKKFE